MVNLCESLIKDDIQSNCESPVVGKLEPNAKIINRVSIDFGATEFHATRKNVIETLVLKTGERAYDAYVPNEEGFNGTKTAMEKGTYRNTFTNDFQAIIFDNGPDVCSKIVDGLADGTFVVVFENKYKNLQQATNAGDSAFQIFGYYQGLRTEELENDKYSEDTDGGWRVLLRESKAPKSALFLYDTDYATTKEAFDSLITPVP
jgi:hypothetical protein